MLQKIKQEQADKIKTRLNNEKIQAIVKTIKELGDDRNFKVIASTGDIDRDNEIIDQNGWELSNYLKNPVILFGHNSRELPIGVATKVYVENDQLIIEGKFASKEANPMAENVKVLYDEKIIKTVSVGFIGKEYEIKTINQKEVWIWTKAELLELSFVPVPANPEAVSLMKEKGLDVKTLTQEIKCEKKDTEKRVDRLEKIAIKHDEELGKIHKRITRKYNDVMTKLHNKASNRKADSEGESKGFDEASVSYLKDKKALLQDVVKFASDALHQIKKS